MVLIDVSALKIKIGKFIGSVFSVKGPVDVDIKKNKAKIQELNQTQDNSINIQIFDPELTKRLIGNVEKPPSATASIFADPAGSAVLPPTKDSKSKAKSLLKTNLVEHNKNPSYSLDVGRLIFVYGERLNIDFSKDELVFLLRSSLKSDFPFWYWCFLYREKFKEVVPLLLQGFKTIDIKVRLGIVDVLSRFTDTGDYIAKLAETEHNEIVLGAMVVKLFNNGYLDQSQRVIVNAISRRLIPCLDYRDIKTLNATLGINEKEFLYKVIKKGWPDDKVKALNILGATISEDDLPLIENLLENESYSKIELSALHCIIKIGRTNNQEFLEKELEDARSAELFIQILGALVAVKARSILPKIYGWLKDTSSISWRFLLGFDKWRLDQSLTQAIVALFDEDFYELVINDILKQPKGKYWHMFTWRQFNVLRSVNDKKIFKLIKNETRLKGVPEWKELLDGIGLQEAIPRGNKAGFVKMVTQVNYTLSMLALREVWKIVSQEEALEIRDIIESLRSDLKERLEFFAIGDYPKKIKSVAKNELDYFLGDNSIFARIGKDPLRSRAEKDKNKPFAKLLKDIEKFERIEDEFISFILRSKNNISKAFLIGQIGRPFKSIYGAITPDWKGLQSEDIKDSIKNLTFFP